jgi:uncharacterized protein (TIGR02646 family)
LTQHRARAHADYDDYADKGTLRDQLVSEQRGLCCFCGGRIVAGAGRMKIAHWMPITADPGLQLVYGNLLGACRGNEGQSKARQHCDTHQGHDRLSRNPANPADQIGEFIQFLPDGAISSHGSDLAREPGQRTEDGGLEEGVLNLNLPFLRSNRKKASSAFTTGLRKRGRLAKPALRKLISVRRGEGLGQLDAYAPVIVYWLRKRLLRA